MEIIVRSVGRNGSDFSMEEDEDVKIIAAHIVTTKRAHYRLTEVKGGMRIERMDKGALMSVIPTHKNIILLGD